MKIVLDAGHGLSTPGKRTPDGMKEFEFNSKVAEFLKDALEGYENVDVMFTHDPTGKRDVPLDERTDKANSWGADVFVSIHANAFGDGWNNAHGIETYAYITRPKEAVELAEKVQHELVEVTGLTNRGIKYANFAVLRQTEMTAILCECGFMSNREEASLLKTHEYRLKVASAILKGLVAQYNLKQKPKPISQSKGLYKVQVGAFANKDSADRLAKELQSKGYTTYIVFE